MVKFSLRVARHCEARSNLLYGFRADRVYEIRLLSRLAGQTVPRNDDPISWQQPMSVIREIYGTILNGC